MTLEQDVYLRGRPFLTPEPKPDRNPRPPSGRPGVRPVRIPDSLMLLCTSMSIRVRPTVRVRRPSGFLSVIVKVAVGVVEREIATVIIILAIGVDFCFGNDERSRRLKTTSATSSFFFVLTLVQHGTFVDHYNFAQGIADLIHPLTPSICHSHVNPPPLTLFLTLSFTKANR